MSLGTHMGVDILYIISLLTYADPLTKDTIMFVNNYRKLQHLCVHTYPVGCVYPSALPDKRIY